MRILKISTDFRDMERLNIAGMGFIYLYELILCDSSCLFSELLYVHNVDMGTCDLHELILCVSEGVLS